MREPSAVVPTLERQAVSHVLLVTAAVALVCVSCLAMGVSAATAHGESPTLSLATSDNETANGSVMDLYGDATNISGGETISNVTLRQYSERLYRIDTPPSHYLNVSFDANWTDVSQRIVNIYPEYQSSSGVGLTADDGAAVFNDDGRPYYIWVYNYESNPIRYSMTVETGPLEDDTAEPDDDRANATMLTPGDTVTDRRLVLDDKDYYRTHLEEGDLLITNVTAQTNASVEVSISNRSTGESATSRGEGTNVTTRLAADRSGTYTIVVEQDDYIDDRVSPYTLSTRVLDAPENDALEPNDDHDQATVVEANTTLSDLQIVADESDFFVLDASAGERISLTLDSADPGVYVSAQHPYNASNHSLSYVARYSGSQRFWVRTSTGRSGSYTLAVNTSGIVANDAAEPNDNRSTATPIARNATLDDRMIVGEDTDYYAVDLTAGEQFRATLTEQARSVRTDLSLYGPDGSLLDREWYGDEANRTVIATVSETGAHYLSVDASGVGNYTVETAVTPNPPINHNSTTATPLGPNAVRSDLQLANNEVDVYAVSLSAGDRLTAEVDLLQAEASLRLELADEDGEVLHTNTLRQPPTLTTLVGHTGTYYLAISGDSSVYDLSTTTTAIGMDDDDAEPNDDIENATPIAANTTVTERRLLGSDEDYYAVTVGPGDSLGVTYPEAVSVDIRREDGEHFDIDYTRGVDDIVTYPNPQTTPTTYYLSFQGPPERVTNYTFSTRVYPGEPNDAYWPNDNLTDATPLNVSGTLRDLRIVGSEIDVFAVNLTAGEQFRATVVGSDRRLSPTDIYVYILNASGTVVASSQDDTDGLTATFGPTAEGSYYVLVDGEQPIESSGVDYALSTGVSPAVEDDREPNDDRSQAASLPDGRHDNLTLLAGDTDVYSVFVPHNGSLDTSLTLADGNGTVDFSVTGPAGPIVSRTTSTNASVTESGLAGGTYHLTVDGSATTRAYSLSVETGVGPDAPTVSVRPSNVSMRTGTNTTVDIVATVPRGTQGQTFTLSLSNGSVANLTDISFPREPMFGTSEIAADNDSVRIEAGYSDPLTGSSSQLLVTLGIEAIAPGETGLNLSDVGMSDDENEQYRLAPPEDGRLTVSTDGMAVTGRQLARSLDGDALLEDVNGDGEANIFDALTYYNNRERDVIQDNPAQFDFDGDGTAGTVFDAIELYRDIQ